MFNRKLKRKIETQRQHINALKRVIERLGLANKEESVKYTPEELMSIAVDAFGIDSFDKLEVNIEVFSGYPNMCMIFDGEAVIFDNIEEETESLSAMFGTLLSSKDVESLYDLLPKVKFKQKEFRKR